jgi:hypothetical protein
LKTLTFYFHLGALLSPKLYWFVLGWKLPALE